MLGDLDLNMKFFISGEISDTQRSDLIPEKFTVLSQNISQRLNEELGGKNYGDAINQISVIPIILQDDVEFFTRIKERKLIKHLEKTTDFRLRINYQKFNHGDEGTRKKLIIRNIIDSVRIIKRRLKYKFNGEQLEQDILTVWELKYSDLEKI